MDKQIRENLEKTEIGVKFKGEFFTLYMLFPF